MRAIRVVLVFSLVFWSSLEAEWAVAFAADGASSEAAPAVQSPGSGSSEQPAETGEGGGSASAEDPTPQPENPQPTGGDDQQDDDAAQQTADAAAAQAVIDAIASVRGATADDRAAVDSVIASLAALTPAQSALVPDELKSELQAISDRVDELIAERDAEDEFDEDERFDAAKHSEGTLVDIEAWTVKAAGDEHAAEAVRSARLTAEEHGYETPKLSTVDGKLQIVAVPKWAADDDLDASWKPKALKADFLKWTVAGNDGFAEVTADGGVLNISALSEGSFVLSCTVDNGKNEKGEQVSTDYTKLVSGAFAEDYPGKSFSVVFSVEVLGPYIDIELLQADGTTCAGLRSLPLNNDQLKSYEFQANVRVYDQVSEGAIDEFRCTSVQGLKDLSAAKYGDKFDDLTWQVFDADRNPLSDSVATISDRGVLSFKGDIDKDGPIIVRVSSPAGFNQNPASAEVAIGDVKEDPQGESHPQESLHIVSNGRIGGDEKAAEGASGDAEKPAADEPEPAAGAQAEADEPEDGASSADAADPEADKPAEKRSIDKIYTVAQIEALGKTTSTYTMQGASGPLTVLGEGVSLELLLADAGIADLTQIASLDFVDYRGVSTTVTWADISSGTQDPLIAVRSRVLSNDEGSDKADLLDNTRFRLLFYGSASLDPDAFRWIKEIRVNVEASSEGGSESGDLAVHVDYVPVPRGKQAVLSAIPNQAIGSARFGFKWQTSADGENWTDVPDGAVQTLRLMTDDEHIGRQYRVVLETDMVNPDTGATFTATSKPVKIEEGNGFTAALAYDPPVAGQTAIFQSSVEAFVNGHQISIEPSNLEYVWEKSEDGGASWTTIPNATGPSLAVPTEPIEQSDDASSAQDASDEPADETPVTLVYVRVRVVTTDTRIPEAGRIAVSNAQPLTVRVGGAGDDENGGNDAGVIDDESTDGAADKLPTDDSTPPDVITPGNGGSPNVTEITDIRVDNTPRPSVQPTAVTTEPTQQAPTPQQQPAQTTPAAQEVKPDELLINPEVTALVLEQEAAIDKAVTSSRPGARWTELSTVDPTDEDVRRILADNPFAPFVLPLGLGIAVAGGLEKLLAFRRETD